MLETTPPREIERVAVPASLPPFNIPVGGSRPPVARQPPPCRVTFQPDVTKLEPLRAAWQDLARSVRHANPFFEPFMLLPALRFLAGRDGVEVALIYSGDRLCGLVPLVRTQRWRGIPVAATSLWQYRHCYDATPLLRAGHERAALGALVHALGERAALLELRGITFEGDVRCALVDVLAERRLAAETSGRFVRAYLRPATDAAAYRDAAVSSARRKELRRQERRLSERGRHAYDALSPGGPLTRWVEEFIELEARGWKGRAGTALGASLANRRFFHSVAASAFAENRLVMLALRVDGRPVAMKCNLLAGDGAVAFKIAYDESFARYSPGVLLELHNIDWFHERPALRWMDSCAAADHPMINRLWTERIGFETVLLATRPSRRVAAFVAATPLIRWAHHQLIREPQEDHARP